MVTASSYPWRQTPQVPARGKRWTKVTDLLAMAVVLLAPVRWVVDVTDWRTAAVLTATSLVAVVVTGRLGEQRWLARLVLALLLGALAERLAGGVAGLWTLLSVTLCDWVIRGYRPVPGLPRGNEAAVAPVVVLSLVAFWRTGHSDPGVSIVVILCATVLVAATTAAFGARAGRAIAAVGAAAGRAASTLGFGLLAVVVVIVPWVAQRILRVDPLGPAGSLSTAWHRRARRDVRPDEPWAAEAMLSEPSASVRWRRLLVGPLSVVVIVGSIGGAAVLARELLRTTDAAPGPDGTQPPFVGQPSALAGLDWWPAYHDELEWIFDGSGFDPFNIPRMADMSSPYINVTDGQRASWTPPECDCVRLDVWLYGGSTVFGLGQRDHHTIPSELARVAWEEGIALDVANRGVPGDLHWQEADRLAWDLAAEDPPDLVLFYDGANELDAARGRNLDGTADAIHRTDQVIDRLRRQGELPEPGVPQPDSVELPVAENTQLAPRELAAATMDRYEVSRRMSKATARAWSVPVMWFWQPTAAVRDGVVGEPSMDQSSVELASELRRRLPSEVMDLSGALDTFSEPVFYDWVHTNERGARAIAASMYAAARSELRQLVSDRESSP